MSSSSSTENYGQNIVENGDFLTSSSGWSLSGGVLYSEGKIVFPIGSPFIKTISQPLEIIPGKQYLAEYVLTVSSGTVTSSIILGDSYKFHNTSSGVLSVLLSPQEDGFIRISVETNNGGAEVTSISVREFIVNSESSLNSGKTSSSSSESSTKNLDSSFSSTSSSKTTYSSISFSTSDSSISFSQSSSTSSGDNGNLEFPFRIEILQESPVWCFERVDDNLYAGTGRNGIILRSRNLDSWEEWQTVEDSHVKSLKSYANGLFIGTEPNGYIYVYNFSTDRFYKYVETYDHSVSSMVIFNGKLYAGTSPGGFLFSFNGVFWSKETQFYGGGITSLFVYDNKLYVSVKSAETLMVYDGELWKVISVNNVEIPEDLDLIGKESNKEGILTVSSFRNLSTEVVSETEKYIDRTKISNTNELISEGKLSLKDVLNIYPTNLENNIVSINSFDGNLLIGGEKGRILKYDGEVFKTVHDNSNSGVVSISSDGFFCTKDSLFIIPESESE